MNDDEIKRYMANMKGDQANRSDEENLASGTKTRITRGNELNHDDIDFDLNNPNADKTHLEYDENDLPLSLKSDAIVGKKNNNTSKLDIATPVPNELNRNTFRAKTDEELNDKSLIDKKPKFRGTQKGYDDNSIKMGSVDDSEIDNDSLFNKNMKKHHGKVDANNKGTRKNSIA